MIPGALPSGFFPKALSCLGHSQDARSRIIPNLSSFPGFDSSRQMTHVNHLELHLNYSKCSKTTIGMIILLDRLSEQRLGLICIYKSFYLLTISAYLIL